MFLPDAEKEIKNVCLADLPTGSLGVISRVLGRGPFRKRISEMGFVRGQVVRVVKSAPMKDPVEYEIMGYKVSLRRSEARMIQVIAHHTEIEQVIAYHAETEQVIEITDHRTFRQWRYRIGHRQERKGSNRHFGHRIAAPGIGINGPQYSGSPFVEKEPSRTHNFVGQQHEPERIAVRSADLVPNRFEGVIDEKSLKTSDKPKGKVISIALVGNPNCGKTTLFNYASGSKERVGNYAGVTIDAKEAKFKMDPYTFRISDLPGTYSITEYSPEELFVRNHISEKKPDVVVNVIDASNLERNLYLTTQLIDMNIKVIIALNMYDELQLKPGKFDFSHLGRMIGIPIVPTVASKGTGLKELFAHIIEIYEERDPIVRHIHINYGEEIESSIRDIKEEIKKDKFRNKNYSSRFLAIKLLEEDNHALNVLRNSPDFETVRQTANREKTRLAQLFGDQSETLIADAKYGFIAGALKETYHTELQIRSRKSFEIDNILTHKIWGFPIFVFFIWLTFHVTFTMGSYPMEWIDAGIGWLGRQIGSIMPGGPLRDLIVDGIIGGVGGVIIFLPNILILFFFISLMEDSGYMARAAFIMDKLMHKIGLHGKSFIPLIMGFGCNVPAVMATRTLDNKNDRLLTMLIIPFMSCSARLPVYVLLISAFFVSYQGAVLFMMYCIGIVMAVLMGLLFKKILFSKKDVPFVMELPPYRTPTLRNTTKHMWHKGSQYLKKMGTVILFASIIIWALGYYPRNIKFSQDYVAMLAQVDVDQTLTETQRVEKAGIIQLSMEEERQENSYIGKMGRVIEPVIQPLGFDWKIGMSIITGMAAKEIVVSSMGVLYKAGLDADENSQSLKEKLQEQTFTRGPKVGQKVFSPLVALTLMVFVLIYFPCVAVVAAIKKEANWKWAIFTSVYTTALAWIAAFAVYQIGSLFI